MCSHGGAHDGAECLCVLLAFNYWCCSQLTFFIVKKFMYLVLLGSSVEYKENVYLLLGVSSR